MSQDGSPTTEKRYIEILVSDKLLDEFNSEYLCDNSVIELKNNKYLEGIMWFSELFPPPDE